MNIEATNAVIRERKRIREEIEKQKEATRIETGSFKYDVYYDEALEIVGV